MDFGSDNQSGVSPRILQAMLDACSATAGSYGSDPWTREAEAAVARVFGCEPRVFFVATGTAANCLALSALVPAWGAIFCHRQAHIATDESTAPEFFTGGARLVTVATDTGKITADALLTALKRLPDAPPHSVRPAALSLTQATENGLVYTPDELRTLTDVAHAHGMHVHMDGARFANAVAALGCTPAELSSAAGIDVLTLGASKNGALAAEAVVFFTTALAADFPMRRKRAGQLVSKGRLFGAQFNAWLQDDHWLELAAQANTGARQLAAALLSHPAIRLAWPVQANEVFVVMPRALLERLHGAGVQCYDWYMDSLPADMPLVADEVPVRFVTAWSTTRSNVAALQVLLQG